MNKILMVFTSTATAVFGVYFKLQSFIFMPVFGLNNGMVPIIAYNYGAKKAGANQKDNCTEHSLCRWYYGSGTFDLPVCDNSAAAHFNASDEMLAIGIPALRIISFSFLGAGFGITASSVFQATGHGFLSLAVSVIRQLLVLLPVAYILSRSADWKFSGGHSPLRRFLRLQSVRCFCAMCTKRD